MATADVLTYNLEDLKAHTTREELYVLLSGKGMCASLVLRVSVSSLELTSFVFLHPTVYNVTKFLDEVWPHSSWYYDCDYSY